MNLPRITFCFVAVFTVLALTCGRLPAALVDWDTLAWAPGSLSNSYNVDPANPGNDVTVSLTGNVNTLTTDATSGADSPVINMSLTGGTSPAENSLLLAADLKTTTKITFTVTFASIKGVAGVSFSLFDIDLETNKDQVKNIYGIALDGSHVAATISLGPAVNRTGTGLAQVLSGNAASPNTGPGSSNGNALISFDVPVTGFSFTWTNTAGAPRYQEIGVGDITFTPIPEMNPAVLIWLVSGLAVAASGPSLRRRRRS